MLPAVWPSYSVLESPSRRCIVAECRAESIAIVDLRRHMSLLLISASPPPAGPVARDADRPGFTENDVEVAEEFARRLADAMANAETLAREHRIAETLQRAVLPDAFPVVPGLDLAAGYLPASDGVHVGGDWYDVFLLCDNRVGLVIGDVAGHSIGSASIIGQVRSMLRAYAIDRRTPATCCSGPTPPCSGCSPRRSRARSTPSSTWPPATSSMPTRGTRHRC